jgi:predicted transcriptional regulator
MPATIDQAIDALRKLSPQRQGELADHIIDLATDEPEEIEPAALAAVLEGMAQAERGEFATDEQVAAAFGRFGR